MPDVIKTDGQWVFELQLDGVTKERKLAVPYPVASDNANTQTAVNNAYEFFTSSTNRQNKIVQPSDWRDEDYTEDEWTTTGLRFEHITTQTHVTDYDPS